MRINKFLFVNNALRFKILILLFSFVFNIFTPTFLACRGRLNSGGQLSFAVIPEKKKNRRHNKKSLSIENVNANINNSANMNVSVDDQVKPEASPELNSSKPEMPTIQQENTVTELKPEVQVTQQEQATPEVKVQEVKPEVKPEIKQDKKQDIKDIKIDAQAGQQQVSPEVKTQDVLGEKEESGQAQDAEKKSGLKIDLQKIAAPESKNLRRVFKFPNSINNNQFDQLDPLGQQKRLAEKLDNGDEETVVFNFEDVDLANVAAYVETLFDVKFITDEAINPMAPQSSKALSGNKVSFKTQKPLIKKQAWSLFVTFLNMAGLALVPMADKNFYRITLIAEAKKSAIPVYINTDNFPDSGIIRYGYFVKDCPLTTMESVINSLKGPSADLLILNDHNAFIITDDAYNIKILMKIVKELDKVTMPQTMSVVKLYKGEARYAQEIYEKLISEGENSAVAARLFGPKTPSKALYFPKKAKVIVDERTNSLILLGTVEAIETIEDFVKKYIDIDIDAPYSPLYIYDLKYATAQDVANLMTNLVQFGTKNQAGAIRSGDKYFKNMTFTAESEGNKLIVRGDYDDWLKAKDIIDQIDEAPKQIAMEILILNVELQDKKSLGAQLRNQFKSPDGSPINFQTSGISFGSSAQPIVLNQSNPTPGTGAFRLLGDLINLVTGSTAGSTAISLGSDKYGIWGMFGILDSLTNTQVVANPFLTVTNNTKANVTLGETIRVVTANVVGNQQVNAFDNYDAFIDVTVTPKINSDGMIVTELIIKYDDFIPGTGGVINSKNTRTIQTTAILANNEVMALGGLIKNNETDTLTQVPILGKIPLIGWLFKNKIKNKNKKDLLILMTAHLVEKDEKIKEHTKRHLKEYTETLDEFEATKSTRDPIDKAFFKDRNSGFKLDNYLFSRDADQEISDKEVGVKSLNSVNNMAPVVNGQKETLGKKAGKNRKNYRRSNKLSEQETVKISKQEKKRLRFEKKQQKETTNQAAQGMSATASRLIPSFRGTADERVGQQNIKAKRLVERENKKLAKEAKKSNKLEKVKEKRVRAPKKESRASKRKSHVAQIATSREQLSVEDQKIQEGRRLGKMKLEEIKAEIGAGA